MMEDTSEQLYRPAKRPRRDSNSSESDADDECPVGGCGICLGRRWDSHFNTAVSNLQLDLVKLMISKGFSVNARYPPEGETPLTTISRLRPPVSKKSLHVDVIKTLIMSGALVNLKNRREQTPLHVARTANAVKVLVSNGASVHVHDEQGETPLFVACKVKRSADVVSALLEGGGADAVNWWPIRSPLHVASHPKMKLLLQKGANPDGVGEDESPLFTYVKKKPCPFDMITTLLEHGASINFKTWSGRTPLHAAVAKTNGLMENFQFVLRGTNDAVETVQFLLQKGATVNEVDSNGESPLFLAAKKPVANDDVINLLLKSGASIHMKNSRGRTALHDSRCSTKTLLKNGAAVNETDKFGETPLFLACRGQSCLDNASILLQYGADINHKNLKGNTPLHAACSNFRKGTVSLFLCNGASVNEANNAGRSPIFAVTKVKKEPCLDEVIDMLLEHGASIDKKDCLGQTPLHVACTKGAADSVVSLLQHGASVNVADNMMRTPFTLAKNYDLGRVLLEYGADHCMLKPETCLGKRCPYFYQHGFISDHIDKLVESIIMTDKYDFASGFGPELIAMKSSMVGRSSVSYLDLLHLNVPRSDYVEVLSFVDRTLLAALFPKFANMIYCSYLKIKKVLLVDECCHFFSLTTLPYLPPEVVCTVLGYLSIADLAVLIHILKHASAPKAYGCP